MMINLHLTKTWKLKICFVLIPDGTPRSKHLNEHVYINLIRSI